MYGGWADPFFVDHVPLDFLLCPQTSLKSTSPAPAGLFHRGLFRMEAEAAPGKMLPVHGVLFRPIRPIVLQSFKSPYNYTFPMD